jgi:hypothetical protein
MTGVGSAKTKALGLLDRFGMKVGIDLDGAAADGVSAELVTARLAHALVGVAEAHASRPEDAARRAGAGVADIGEVARPVASVGHQPPT